MKNMLLLVCFAVSAFVAQAQTAASTTPAATKPVEILQEKETSYNFGKNQQVRQATHN